MTTRPTLQNGAILRVRLYRPDDNSQVLSIFRHGMEGLAPTGATQLVQNNRSLQVLSCAVPAAALLLTPRRWSLAVKAAAGMGAAIAVPAVLFGTLWRLLSAYVNQSLKEDMCDIATHYSPSGAGHGSAFWVAELLEPLPALPPAPPTPEPSAAPVTAPPGPPSPLQPTPALSDAPKREAQAASVSAEAPAEGSIGPAGKQEVARAAAAASDVAASGLGLEAAPLTQPGGGAEAQEPAASSGSAEDSEEQEVRLLVRGLVAAAVAKLEAAAAVADSITAASSPRSRSTTEAADTLVALDAAAPSTASADKATSAKLYSNGTSVQVSATAPSALAPAAPPAATTAAAVLPRPPSSALLAAPRGAESKSGAAAAAAAPRYRSTIIGHVALERKTWQVAELRRMSVAPGFRGLGVGSRLLETLMQHARDNGFRELVLTTSSMQLPARRLYEKAGWVAAEVTRGGHGLSFYTYKYDLIKKR